MNKAMGILELSQKIEELVRGYMAEVHEGAKAALERALGGRNGSAVPAALVVAAPRAKREAKGLERRDPAAVAALAESFYVVLCATPGESMAVLASKVGATPGALHRPVANLKRAGRVRSVGERQRTRYFPMPADARV